MSKDVIIKVVAGVITTALISLVFLYQERITALQVRLDALVVTVDEMRKSPVSDT